MKLLAGVSPRVWRGSQLLWLGSAVCGMRPKVKLRLSYPTPDKEYIPPTAGQLPSV